MAGALCTTTQQRVELALLLNRTYFETFIIDADDGSEVDIFETLAGEVVGPEAELIKKKELQRYLAQLMSECLTEGQIKILTQAYGLDGGRECSQRETSELTGASRSGVGLVASKAMDALREHMRSLGLELTDFLED